MTKHAESIPRAASRQLGLGPVCLGLGSFIWTWGHSVGFGVILVGFDFIELDLGFISGAHGPHTPKLHLFGPDLRTLPYP